MDRKQRLIIIGASIIVVLAFISYLILPYKKNQSSSNVAVSNQEENIKNNPPEQAAFDKNLFALDQPGSPWWVVNKKRPLPAGYVPPDLAVPDVRLRLAKTAPQMPFSLSATPALKGMFAAAAGEGVALVFGSGYRSEELQRQFYTSYVAQDGQAAADRYSARPGTSEHQTGLVFDVTTVGENCHLEICFKDTPEGVWVLANAYKYGFIVRYPDGKEQITGYQYEPWHLRFVGRELAAEMHKTGVQTMEEFFGLPPAPTY